MGSETKKVAMAANGHDVSDDKVLQHDQLLEAEVDIWKDVLDKNLPNIESQTPSDRQGSCKIPE